MSIELNNSMNYLIYKITNLVNGRFYIGAHQTENINDGYMGSGKALHAAYKKYGVEKFRKEIIRCCSSVEEMYEVEKELVEPFYKNKKSYNIMEGGRGGFNFINDSGQNGAVKGVIKRLELFADAEWYEVWKDKQRKGCKAHAETVSKSEFSRRGKQANQTAKLRNGVYSFEGKQHTEETKLMIGKKNSIHQSGKNNSRFGSMWITNGVVSKSVPKDSIISAEWYKGRKINQRSR